MLYGESKSAGSCCGHFKSHTKRDATLGVLLAEPSPLVVSEADSRRTVRPVTRDGLGPVLMDNFQEFLVCEGCTVVLHVDEVQMVRPDEDVQQLGPSSDEVP